MWIFFRPRRAFHRVGPLDGLSETRSSSSSTRSSSLRVVHGPLHLVVVIVLEVQHPALEEKLVGVIDFFFFFNEKIKKLFC
jgi:hypothetical protein